MIPALLAAIALQASPMGPAPRDLMDLAILTHEVGQCQAYGFQGHYEQFDTWLSDIRAGNPGMSQAGAMQSIDRMNDDLNKELALELDGINSRATHLQYVEEGVEVCEVIARQYPDLLSRLPTTDTTIASLKQYAVDLYPE